MVSFTFQKMFIKIFFNYIFKYTKNNFSVISVFHYYEKVIRILY